MIFCRKNRIENIGLLDEELEKFKITLINIFQLLKKSNNLAQADFIQKQIDLITQHNFKLFIKSLNGLEMWGGSGAVWEVYFENKDEYKLFKGELLNLIALMKKSKMLGKGIKPIQKIFEKN